MHRNPDNIFSDSEKSKVKVNLQLFWTLNDTYQENIYHYHKYFIKCAKNYTQTF